MATGINTDKMNQLKVDLLDYVESINALRERLDNCRTIIKSNMSGAGRYEIDVKMYNILCQIPRVSGNINSYISVLNKVEKSYENQDSKLASDVIRNISKLEQ